MFNLNDEVKWVSHSRGRHTLKVGKIVAVMQPGEPVNKDICNGKVKFDYFGPRRTVNYLIRVDKKLYRPKVSQLMSVND